MKHTYKIFLVVFLLFIVRVAFAAENAPSVRSYEDKNKIFIGDRVKYTIVVGSRKELDIQFEKFKDNKIGDFEVKDTGGVAKTGWFGNRLYLHWYIITIYSPGKHSIAPISLKYKQKGGKDWSVLNAKEVIINVESLLPKNGAAKDIRDIKGPITLRETNWVLISIIAGTVFAIMLAVLLYMRIAGRPTPLPPHEVALRKLGALMDLLSKTGDVKEHYAGISNCIRDYIEMTFSLRAPEMTTEEFLNSLEKSRFLSLEYKSLLKDFLMACDMVKFAKYAPTKNETESVFTTAKRFVEETKSSSLAAEAKGVC